MQTGQKIDSSLTASTSLKLAWAALKNRDGVDAYHDALAFVQACKERLDAARS